MSLIEELRSDDRSKTRICPLCREAATEMVLEVKIRERASSGRSGTTAVKSRTLCGSCAVALFEQFVGDLTRREQEPPK